jgi:hypothetical protein
VIIVIWVLLVIIAFTLINIAVSIDTIAKKSREIEMHLFFIKVELMNK